MNNYFGEDSISKFKNQQINDIIRAVDERARATNNIGPDYDYSVAAAYNNSPDTRGHLSDIGKLPWHPTFSNQSAYSKQHQLENKHPLVKYANPNKAPVGGVWSEYNGIVTYTPSQEMVQKGYIGGLAKYMKLVEPDAKLSAPVPYSNKVFNSK